MEGEVDRMLLTYGNTLVWPQWRVDEPAPPGFSRVYRVRGGSVVYTDEKLTFPLERDWLYVFPSARGYRLEQDPEDCLRCTFLHMDMFPVPVTKPIALPLSENPLLHHLFEAIAAAIEEGEPYLLEDLAAVFERFCRDRGLIHPPARPIYESLEYIAEHIRENITVGELSRRAGYNEQYFIRLFKKHMHLTPYQYIISFRLKEARRLLREGATVTRAAALSGFGDVKAFSRCFKYNFGLTPSDFRKGPELKP